MSFYSFRILSVLILINVFPQYLFAQFAGGSGTEDDPYQVSTIQQLQEIINFTDKHFIQINDIDASVTRQWNDSTGFSPIGDELFPFIGQYDGKGYSINYLYMKRIDDFDVHVGVFGTVKDAIMKNINLLEINIYGSNRTGALSGDMLTSIVTNVHVTGYIEGAFDVGGLIGHSAGNDISNSSANVSIIARGKAGGIAGYCSGGIITNNHAYGKITKSELSNSGDTFGGLIGEYRGSLNNTIEESFASFNIDGRDNIGGLIGVLVRGYLKDSYSLSNIKGRDRVGGLIALNDENSRVFRSYSVGDISGSSDVGGFIGANTSSAYVYSGFWNADSIDVGVGRGDTSRIIGLKTSQMQADSAYFYMPEFDFENIWLLTKDYPALYWENVESITPPEVEPPASVNLISPNNEASDIGVDTVLTWSFTDANYYELQVSSDSTFTSLILSDSEIPDALYQLSGQLDFGHKYYWRVRAKNLAGASEWSQINSFTTEFALPTPSLDTPLDSLQEASIPTHFVWNPVDGANDYELQLSQTDNFDSIVDINISDAEKSVKKSWKITQEVDGLDYNKRYYWRVRASNADGVSDWSLNRTFITESGIPSIPVWSPDNGEQNVTTSPLLDWNSSRNADTYQVQLTKDDTFDNLVLDVIDIPETNYQVNNLDGSTTYYWRVQAHNNIGASGWSETLSFTTKVSTSNEDDLPLPTEFTLNQNYPNPFNPATQISYEIPRASEVELAVFNMLGQRVATLVNQKQSAGRHMTIFDASGLSSGFYIYRIRADEFVQSKKLMLIK